MQKRLLFLFVAILSSIALIIITENRADSNNAGAPSGMSGAPGENNCRSCHNSAALNSGAAIASITTNIPPSGYVGGQTYTITAMISQPGIGKFGFQISAEKGNGSNTGSWTITNSTATQIISTNYVTHRSTGVLGSGSRAWSMDWKAPCSGEGTIKFYAAMNACNNNSANSGDTVYTRAITVIENLINSADSVSNLTAADVGNDLDGRDLQVSFKTSKCESRTSEYRVIAVKLLKSSAFTIDSAKVLPAGNYAVVNTGPPNATKNKKFGASGKDSDGDAIKNKEPYKIFVLSVAKAGVVTNDTMLALAGSITLTSSIVGVNTIATQIVGNSGNASDLEVSFNTAGIEKAIGEYRTMVVKSASSGSFSLIDANAVPSSIYKSTPVGTPATGIQINYLAGDKDTDGDTLLPLEPYRIFVLVKADGTFSTIDTLQMAENDVIIPLPLEDKVEKHLSDQIEIIQYDGILTISLKSLNIANIDFEIYSIDGRLLKRGPVNGYPFVIDLNRVNIKMGFIRLTCNNESVIKKIIR